MSLIPFIIDLADELHELGRCLANGIDIDDFGFGIYAAGEHTPSSSTAAAAAHQANTRRTRSTPFYWLPSKRHHPYCRTKSTCCSKISTDDVNNTGPVDRDTSGILNTSTNNTPGKSTAYSVVNRNGFQVSMNVKQFASNELSVKTINNCIMVEGRHDDKEDGHGVISRHFVRKYMLPKGYDPNDVISTLSSDGILTVRAPPPLATKNNERQERIVEIQPFSGPAQLIVTAAKENPKESQVKNTQTLNSIVNQPPEKKQKLDQSVEEKLDENKLNESLKENTVKPLQPIQQQQQQQQQQTQLLQEQINDVEKIITNQQQQEKDNIGQTNEGSTQTDVVVVSLNIQKLQENGDIKAAISDPNTEADPLLDSSCIETTIVPAKIIETDTKKPITANIRAAQNNDNAINTLINNNNELKNFANTNNSNSTNTSEQEDTNANVTAVGTNINNFITTTTTTSKQQALTSSPQPPTLLLRSNNDNNSLIISDTLPTSATELDGDIEMNTADGINIDNDVSLLKSVAPNMMVLTRNSNETEAATIIDEQECDPFKAHLESNNKTALSLGNEEITN